MFNVYAMTKLCEKSDAHENVCRHTHKSVKCKAAVSPCVLFSSDPGFHCFFFIGIARCEGGFWKDKSNKYQTNLFCKKTKEDRQASGSVQQGKVQVPSCPTHCVMGLPC